MRGIDLLYAIGQIDDRFIERAGKQSILKSKIKAICGTAAAACLIFAVIISVSHFTSTDKNSAGELAPMVYVNSTLYIQSENMECFSEKEEGFLYLGDISSVVDSSSEPNEELQANDNIVGAPIYQYGKKIVVFYNEKYWVYRPYQE